MTKLWQLFWQDENEQRGLIGEELLSTSDPVEAERILVNKYWDSRLDAASCSPVVVEAD